MITQNKRPIAIVLTVSLLLLVPAIAMRFTDEVSWSPLDFVVAAALLLGTGLLLELVARRVTRRGHRITLFVGILSALVLVWLELAVGIFATP